MASAGLDTPSHDAATADRGDALRMTLTVLGLGVAWEALVRGFDVPAYYLPPLSAVLQAVWAAPGPFVAGMLRTGLETLLGFAAGAENQRLAPDLDPLLPAPMPCDVVVYMREMRLPELPASLVLP